MRWLNDFKQEALTPTEAGLDLDKLQDVLERIAKALEGIERRLNKNG